MTIDRRDGLGALSSLQPVPADEPSEEISPDAINRVRKLAKRLTLLMMLGIAISSIGTVAETSAASSTTEHHIIAERADHRSLVEWATDRFEAAELELPPLTIAVYESREECDGSAGLFYLTPPARIALCAIGDAGAAGSRLIVLHELAHAWAETNADQATLDEFLTIRGLSAWRDPEVPRWRWGQEQVAEVLSWGLMDHNVAVTRIYDAGPDDLAAAYEVLVGQSPLVVEASDADTGA